MPWFASGLRLKTVAGALVSILALVLLPIIYTWTASLQAESFRQVEHTNEVIRQVRRIQVALLETRLAGASPADREVYLKGRDRLRDELVSLEGLVADDGVQTARVIRLRERIDAWLAASTGGRGSQAAAAAGVLLPEVVGLIEEFILAEGGLRIKRTRDNEAARYRNLAVVTIGSGVAILSVLLRSLWITGSLVGPIVDLTRATRRLRDGDLQTRVEVRGDDELGQLAEGFNAMAEAQQRFARELEKRDVQSGVIQVAEVLATSHELAPLLDSALERMLQVSRCPAGALYIRSHDDEALHVLASSGTGPGLADQVVRPGEGIVGRVGASRIAYFSSGPTEEAPFAVHHWLGEQRPAEMAYLPLTAGPDLVGVLALAAVEPFDDRARNLLRIVSGQLGSAIQNALSHQALKRQAVELEARNTRLAQQQAEIERQNRELRVASQLKSEFLANMSHELRTPLTIILGFTSTVLRGTQGGLNDEQADSLRRVYDNARQLLNLINDILDLSKIEAGQMELDIQPIALPSLLESVVEGFRTLAGAKGLALRTELAPDLPSESSGDEVRLRQVLTNLVSNALKFTDRGEVVVAARPFGEGRVELEVRDTGPGIAEADIPKIFEQFRQLDGRTTRKAGGTGLGLSIVNRLVELLGGTIEVRSRLGQGTSFLVRLPIGPGSSVAPAQPTSPFVPTRPDDEPAPERSGRVVLAIDDDEDFLALLRAALSDTPFALRSAASGAEGLEQARRLRPDAITLDVMMPQMDGWRVLSELKADPRTAEIPVILLTVLQRRGLGMMLGAADYLTKPLDRDRLVQSLRRLRHPAQGPILVVDDDPDIREMLSVELRAEGFDRIETAVDGLDGLRRARQERPALVILDLMMPNLDGFEVAAQLQQDESTRDVPILVLTAKDLTAADIHRLNGKIEDILQKGALSVDALIARLVSILRAVGVQQG